MSQQHNQGRLTPIGWGLALLLVLFTSAVTFLQTRSHYRTDVETRIRPMTIEEAITAARSSLPADRRVHSINMVPIDTGGAAFLFEIKLESGESRPVLVAAPGRVHSLAGVFSGALSAGLAAAPAEEQAAQAVLSKMRAQEAESPNQNTEALRQALRERIIRELGSSMAHNSASPFTQEIRQTLGKTVHPLVEGNLPTGKVKTIFDRVTANTDWTISYPADEEQAEVLVFTDYTCPYCQRLHEALPEINAAGITVKYMWMPRVLAQGEDSAAARQVVAQMRNAWCAGNKHDAINRLFKGEALPDNCTEEQAGEIVSLIKEQYMLAMVLEIPGTPLVVTNRGERFSGFSSADAFIASVKAHSDLEPEADGKGADTQVRIGPEDQKLGSGSPEALVRPAP